MQSSQNHGRAAAGPGLRPAVSEGATRLRRPHAGVAFGLALACTLYCALRPHPVPLHLNEDLQHLGAFAVLMVTGGLSRPRRRLPMALGLLVLGAVIEGLQATPFVHRDADLKDWLADAGGVGLAWTLVEAPALCFRLRRRVPGAAGVARNPPNSAAIG